jgi:uncharacterized protein (DUF488 family)
MVSPAIFTIGHSSHPIEHFLNLLRHAGINCLADVRSAPVSARFPQYNQDLLKDALARNGIRYLFFGHEFGARRTAIEELDADGQVDFEKVRGTYAFRNGIERLWQLVHGNATIALMCAEAEPLECHRFSMVSLGLVTEGFEVRHVMKDATIKTHATVEAELLHKFRKKLPMPDLFSPDVTAADQLRVAYRLVNREIGYRPGASDQREGGDG